MKNFYVIEESVLAQLLRYRYELVCLKSWGVDNWEGYSDALNDKEDDCTNYYDYSKKCSYEIVMEYLKNNPNRLYTLEDYKDNGK